MSVLIDNLQEAIHLFAISKSTQNVFLAPLPPIAVAVTAHAVVGRHTSIATLYDANIFRMRVLVARHLKTERCQVATQHVARRLLGRSWTGRIM